MHKPVKATVFTSIALLLLPGIGFTQTCKTTTIIASTPTSQFTIHNNGTITDNKTGLMWKKCSEGQSWNNGTNQCDGNAAMYTWQSALNQAQTVNNTGGMVGKTDWRVPNVRELYSIVEQRCYNPSVNLTVFPEPSIAAFWSSSPYASYVDAAWFVYFSNGRVSMSLKNGNVQVRLVRSGQ